MVTRLEIMLPGLDSFEGGEQLLPVSVVVELGTRYDATEGREGWAWPSSVCTERIPAMA